MQSQPIVHLKSFATGTSVESLTVHTLLQSYRFISNKYDVAFNDYLNRNIHRPIYVRVCVCVCVRRVQFNRRCLVTALSLQTTLQDKLR
jgi:hypothetical protein